MKEKLARGLFIAVFFLILLYPIAGVVFDRVVTLSGVTETVQVEELNTQNLMDGSYQSSLNTWVENNFPGRSLLIRARSQLRYSFLNESSNSNVVIGKGKYLFEPSYIYRELGVYSETDTYFQESIRRLEYLQNLLAAEGKELYLFITPSKAYFYKDMIPDSYFALGHSEENDYSKFMEYLQTSELRYFDSRTFIENYNGQELQAPVYYSTGIHWSHPWGANAAVAFSEYVSANSKWDLSTLSLTEYATEGPNLPDTDLYDTLNLIASPNNVQYYGASVSIALEKDKPNVVMRGGSFMGQSLSYLSFCKMFNKDVYLENSSYATNGFSTSQALSSFSAYEEAVGLPEFLSDADILILEIQEANICNMSFGFIDYLLEHSEYLKYPER